MVREGRKARGGVTPSPRQASAKRVAASTVAAAKAFPAAQAGRSAARRAASMGKPRRSGLRSRWHRQPSSPPPAADRDTARRKATQHGVGGCGRGASQRRRHGHHVRQARRDGHDRGRAPRGRVQGGGGVHGGGGGGGGEEEHEHDDDGHEAKDASCGRAHGACR